MIASIFAATMSTISSNINSLSTAFTIDIFQHFFKGLNDKKQLKVARISGIILGGIGVIIAIIMAGMNILSLFDFFNFILGLLASGIGGLFILGIFFGSVKGKAAFFGFGAGTLTLFIISYLTDISFLLYGFIGLVSTVVFALIWTWILPAEPIDIQKGLTFKSLKINQ
jgi:Na+/proline symporter